MTRQKLRYFEKDGLVVDAKTRVSYKIEIADATKMTNSQEVLAAFVTTVINCLNRDGLDAPGINMSDVFEKTFEVIIGITRRAILVVTTEGDQIWLPKSQLLDANSYAVGQRNVKIAMAGWLAKAKGWSQ